MCSVRTTDNSVNTPPGDIQERPPNRIPWGSYLSAPQFNSLDTLHYGLFVSWPSDTSFFDKLTEAQQRSQETEKRIPVQFNTPDLFLVHPGGKRGGYKWHISAGDHHIFFSKHKALGETPNTFVEIGSLSCWSPGYLPSVHTVQSFINNIGGKVIQSKVNRLDMAVDMVGIDFLDTKILDLSRWIKKAKKFGNYGSGTEYNSIDIGKGGQISIRVYDKKAELVNQQAKKKFFYDHYGLAPDDKTTPILRVEAQIRKKWAKRFGFNTIEDIPFHLAGAWKYITNDWFRLAAHSVNRTHL